MSKKWLLFDSSCMCFRAHHSTGSLQFDSKATGMYFGFFRDVRLIQKFQNTYRVAFFWDLGTSNRCEIIPGYKSSRKQKRLEMTKKEYRELQELYRQMTRLRQVILPDLGFNNNFVQRGYEADDLIASACHEHFAEDSEDVAVIVSSDQDMYQLLGTNVSIFNPHTRKMITEKSFEKKFGITVNMWSTVKSIAGCKSDDVPGVAGVGETTAIRYLLDELPEHYKAHKDILKAGHRIQTNMQAVDLPLEGTDSCELQRDKLNLQAWKRFMLKAGFVDMHFPSIRKLNK